MHAYSFDELCAMTGRGRIYVRRLQSSLSLEKPTTGKYPEGYARFLEKIVALRTLSVPLDRIVRLFELERKILKLLHFDALGQDEYWYLEACQGNPELTETSLMLTEFDLGFHLADGQVQHNLDFGERDRELFRGSEMGEDVHRVIDGYLALVREVTTRIERETPVLKDALMWARWFCSRGAVAATTGPFTVRKT